MRTEIGRGPRSGLFAPFNLVAFNYGAHNYFCGYRVCPRTVKRGAQFESYPVCLENIRSSQ